MKQFGKIALISAFLLAMSGMISCDESRGNGVVSECLDESCEDNGAIYTTDCPSRVYGACSLAPSFQNLKGEQLYDILGPTIIDKGVNFAVYAKHATRVEVLIFDSNNPDTDQPVVRIPMTKDKESGIWTQYVYGVGVGTHYGYIAFGPNWSYDKNFVPGTSIGFITDCDDEGNRYNPNKLLLDPYARRISHDFDWMSGNPASGSARAISDWKAAAKSVVIQSEYQWSENEKTWRENRQLGDSFAGHAQNDLIYYEVHPKGFTMRALDDVKNPGTWRGIGEKAEYLKDLGITALELLPVTEKPDDGGYWGYNPIAYFVPEQRFATAINQKKDNGVLDEFKEMVDKLHQAGIEVILDVVYNHTGEGGLWRSKVQDPANSYGSQSDFDDKTALTIYSFRGLDNKDYYHLVADSTGKTNQKYLDEPGVGNQFRCNNKPGRRLIMDSLRFWVEEMHVDGFRFDLATALGVHEDQITQQGDTKDYGPGGYDNKYWMDNTGTTVLQEIVEDEVLNKYHTRLIAEPWGGYYVNGCFPKSTKDDSKGWSEWNGRFRDMMRDFVNNDDVKLNKEENLSPDWVRKITAGNLLTGSSNMFKDSNGRKPYHSVNVITVHDGFTLYDVMSYWQKNNKCSVLNSICCNDPYNAFCKTDNGSDDNRSRNWCQYCWEAGCDDSHCWDAGCDENKDTQGYCSNNKDKVVGEDYKRQNIRNLMTLLMISAGTPLILGGDEYLRTQYGNNDAYSDSADNEWNWFRWGDWTSNAPNNRMHDFVRELIKLRKQYKEFLAPMEYGTTNVQWWWPDGCGDIENGCWDGKAVGMYYPATEKTKTLYVMINMESDREQYKNAGDGIAEKIFHLPDGEWTILLDTQKYFDTDSYINSINGDLNTTHNIWLDGSNVISGTYGVKARSIVIATK